MLTATTPELDLMSAWSESDPTTRVSFSFPINRATGARDSAVVYFEVAPGDRLPIHTDSAEEVLYIVAGEAEAEVGDERGRLPPATSRSSPRWSRTAWSTSATRR